MQQRTALLVGATGLIGKHCLQLLLNDPVYSKVTALTRREIDMRHERLEQHVVDFDKLSQYATIMKADDVFCALGTTRKKAGGSEAEYEKIDYHYPVEIATLAYGNGATQFLIVTSLGARSDSSVFYLRLKARTEEAVKAIPFKSVHIFRPSMLVGERDEVRWQDIFIPPLMTMLSFAMVGPWRKYRVIKGAIVAAAMVSTSKRNLPGVHIHESDQIQRINTNNV